VLIEQDPTDEPDCTVHINSIEPNRTQVEAEITHRRYPRDPLPMSPIFPDPFPSSPFLSQSRIHRAARAMGRRVHGGTPSATEEIVAAVGLGLWKRSWPPSGWGYGRGHGCRNLPLTPPRSRSKPSPPPEHTRGMGELVLLLVGEFLGARRQLRKRSWLPSGWGYGRGHGRHRVGAMEEVTAVATCLSRRPAPDLNPRHP
jgi:hypothetical protein